MRTLGLIIRNCLFILAMLLLLVGLFVFTVPIGLFYFRGKLWYVIAYLKRIAVSLDQLVNVVHGVALNKIILKKDCVYEFGLEDDTMSEVLAYNGDHCTDAGNMIAASLELIDPGHLKSSLIENENYSKK